MKYTVTVSKPYIQVYTVNYIDYVKNEMELIQGRDYSLADFSLFLRGFASGDWTTNIFDHIQHEDQLRWIYYCFKRLI